MSRGQSRALLKRTDFEETEAPLAQTLKQERVNDLHSYASTATYLLRRRRLAAQRDRCANGQTAHEAIDRYRYTS